MTDPTDLEALRREADEQRKREATEKLIEIGDLKWLMSSKQGRRLMWRLLSQFGVYRSSFNSDALVMAYLEGQRNNGLALMADLLEHAPDRYAEMMQDQKEYNDARRKRSPADDESAGE